MQHIATSLHAPSCARLATLLRHVACCWYKFENGQIFHPTFVDVAWCCTRLAGFLQQCCAKACALYDLQHPTCRNTSQQSGQTRAYVAPNNTAIRRHDWSSQLYTQLKPWSKDRNTSMQHIATCCTRLTTILRRVVTCCETLNVVG